MYWSYFYNAGISFTSSSLPTILHHDGTTAVSCISKAELFGYIFIAKSTLDKGEKSQDRDLFVNYEGVERCPDIHLFQELQILRRTKYKERKMAPGMTKINNERKRDTDSFL